MRTDYKIITYEQLKRKLSKIRKGKTVVAVSGTFDLFHAGHLMFLDDAKDHGDILVVGVGSDRIVKMYKGSTRPILPEKLRTRLIAGLEIVNFVVIIDEKPVDKIAVKTFFKIVSPDKWVVPFQNPNPQGDKKLARELGIELVQAARIKPNRVDFPLSTSYIIEKIREEKKKRPGKKPSRVGRT